MKHNLQPIEKIQMQNYEANMWITDSKINELCDRFNALLPIIQGGGKGTVICTNKKCSLCNPPHKLEVRSEEKCELGVEGCKNKYFHNHTPSDTPKGEEWEEMWTRLIRPNSYSEEYNRTLKSFISTLLATKKEKERERIVGIIKKYQDDCSAQMNTMLEHIIRKLNE